MFKFLVLFILIFLPSFSWANIPISPHQTQGFESYMESVTGTQFSCKKQCFIMLEGMGINDYLSWLGDISGSGSIGYGFLNGQQIIPGEFRSISTNIVMNDRMLFSDNQYYSQIPKNLPIVIIVNGEIQSKNLLVQQMEYTLNESIQKNWSQFIKTENLAQYSINLLYGYSFGETSFTGLLSLVFFVIILGIVFVYSFDRRRFFFPIFLISIMFVVFYDLREQANLYEVRNGYQNNYINVPIIEQKNWFGIGYYPMILEKASKYITQSPVGQKVYLAAMQNFPLFGYSQYHLHPAETIFIEDVKNITSAQKGDIFIRYFSSLLPTGDWKMIYASQDGGVALYIKQ
ncbi:hypothetical protein AUK10_03045 [Candidatus Gracilibacteria bacterium CG2_30_37_12]|nr:MAG: hypothetical protein AUK10_03045 [Candidatus Gracilibacteria bacterium CG2_30_37_12]